MHINTPFELGYVKDINGKSQILCTIDINIKENEYLSITYYNENSSLIFPEVQLTKEGYNTLIEQEKLDKVKEFQNILDVFNEVFNPEDWDYTIIDNSVEFLIKFESFNIQNNKGETHLIRDLFVKLVYDIQNKRFISLKGNRKTLSMAELSSKYIHSHLQYSTSWSSFCLGDGDIKVFYDGMCMINNPAIEQDLRGFLYSLYPYLMWENLDATPWSYIQNIKKDDRKLIDNTSALSNNEIITILSSNDISKFIQIDETTLEINILHNIEYLSCLSKDVQESFLCYYDDRLNPFYGMNESLSNNISFNDIEPIIFKGEKVTMKIVPDENTLDLSTFNRFLSPSNVELINRYITSNFIKTLKQSL